MNCTIFLSDRRFMLFSRQIRMQNLRISKKSSFFDKRFSELDGVYGIRKWLGEQVVGVQFFLADGCHDLGLSPAELRDVALLHTGLLLLDVNRWEDWVKSDRWLLRGRLVEWRNLLRLFLLNNRNLAFFIDFFLIVMVFRWQGYIDELLFGVICYKIVTNFVKVLITLIFLRERVFKTACVDDQAWISLEDFGILFFVCGQMTRWAARYHSIIGGFNRRGDMRVSQLRTRIEDRPFSFGLAKIDIVLIALPITYEISHNLIGCQQLRIVLWRGNRRHYISGRMLK